MRHRMPQFNHVFAGDGYSAGYYSYLWSDTLTADACGGVHRGGRAVRQGGRQAAATTTSSRSATRSTRPTATARSAAATRGSAALMRKRGFPVPPDASRAPPAADLSRRAGVVPTASPPAGEGWRSSLVRLICEMPAWSRMKAYSSAISRKRWKRPDLPPCPASMCAEQQRVGRRSCARAAARPTSPARSTAPGCPTGRSSRASPGRPARATLS